MLRMNYPNEKRGSTREGAAPFPFLCDLTGHEARAEKATCWWRLHAGEHETHRYERVDEMKLAPGCVSHERVRRSRRGLGQIKLLTIGSRDGDEVAIPVPVCDESRAAAGEPAFQAATPGAARHRGGGGHLHIVTLSDFARFQWLLPPDCRAVVRHCRKAVSVCPSLLCDAATKAIQIVGDLKLVYQRSR